MGPSRRGLARRPVLWLAALLLGMIGFELLLGPCVQEDAFISFRYARNLARGNGLVYNPGERVEGYTNFLWTVLIAGGMKLGLPPVPLVRFGGMAASVALVLLVWGSARARDRRRRRAGAGPGAGAAGGEGPGLPLTGGLVAAAVLAASPHLASEAVQGLETVPFAFLVTAGVLLQVRGRDRMASAEGPAGPRLLAAGAAVLAVAALTRPEGLGVVGLSFLGGLAWRLRTGRPPRWRAEAAAAGVFLVIYAPYWLWRYGYYGYPLPNTFYAKTGGGLRHALRGLGYLGRFLLVSPGLAASTAAVALVALVALVAPAGMRRRAASRAVTGPAGGGSASSFPATALVVVAGYLAYVATVGGDFKATFRFILPVLPLWALLLDDGLGRLLVARPRLGRPWPRRGLPAAAAGVWLVLAALAADAVIGTPTTVRWAHRRGWDLVRRTALGRHLAEVARPGDVLAIHSAGIVPYYSDLATIDMWGLNDLHIAHRRVPDMGGSRPTGHEKGDPDYVFGRLPDFFVDEWFCVRSEPMPALAEHVFGDPPQPPQGAFYRARSVPVTLDAGRGPQTYYLNYLVLDEEAARRAGALPANPTAPSGGPSRRP